MSVSRYLWRALDAPAQVCALPGAAGGGAIPLSTVAGGASAPVVFEEECEMQDIGVVCAGVALFAVVRKAQVSEGK